jgi:hypothetical protein
MLTLPPEYVARCVTLGYASPVHATKGCGVETAHIVIGAGTEAARADVALTRGRHCSTVYCVNRSRPYSETGANA